VRVRQSIEDVLQPLCVIACITFSNFSIQSMRDLDRRMRDRGQVSDSWGGAGRSSFRKSAAQVDDDVQALALRSLGQGGASRPVKALTRERRQVADGREV